VLGIDLGSRLKESSKSMRKGLKRAQQAHKMIDVTAKNKFFKTKPIHFV
jgi:hypothetical protein